MRYRLKNLFILLIVLANAGCDQLTKNIARQNLQPDETIAVFGNYLTLTKVENFGAFLSTGDTLPGLFKLLFFSILPSLALLYALYFLLSREDIPKLMIVGMCFVAGGGMGNLFDRLKYGSVTDFLRVDLAMFKTGIFNLADVSIVIGMVLIVFHLYFVKKKPNQIQSQRL